MIDRSRFIHTLVVKKMAPSGGTDDFGQPLAAETTVATVAGLIQPRRGREVTYTTQAGPVVADWYGYCDPLPTLTTDCWLEVSGIRYDVLAVKPEMSHHVEIDLRRIV